MIKVIPPRILTVINQKEFSIFITFYLLSNNSMSSLSIIYYDIEFIIIYTINTAKNDQVNELKNQKLSLNILYFSLFINKYKSSIHNGVEKVAKGFLTFVSQKSPAQISALPNYKS